MRLVIAQCTVDYVGRLTAHLPSARRLLLIKSDGSVSVHADDRAYKPLNWMSPPCWLTEEPDGPPQQELVPPATADLLDDTHEVRGLFRGPQEGSHGAFAPGFSVFISAVSVSRRSSAASSEILPTPYVHAESPW